MLHQFWSKCSTISSSSSQLLLETAPRVPLFPDIELHSDQLLLGAGGATSPAVFCPKRYYEPRNCMHQQRKRTVVGRCGVTIGLPLLVWLAGAWHQYLSAPPSGDEALRWRRRRPSLPPSLPPLSQGWGAVDRTQANTQTHTQDGVAKQSKASNPSPPETKVKLLFRPTLG